MIPVDVHVSVRVGMSCFDAEINLHLHAVPRVDEWFEPIVDSDVVKVRSVFHYCDGRIRLFLDDLKYDRSTVTIDEMAVAFIDAGCKVSDIFREE